MAPTPSVILVLMAALCAAASAARLPFSKRVALELLKGGGGGSDDASSYGDLSAKNAAFSQCCLDKGVFAGIDGIDEKTIADQECNYTHYVNAMTEEDATLNLEVAERMLTHFSDVTKCYGGNQDDTKCCEAGGLSTGCAAICDYTPPVIEPIQYFGTAMGCFLESKSLDKEEVQNIHDVVTKCTTDNAYNRQ